MSQCARLARAVRVAWLLVFALGASLGAAEPNAGSSKSSVPKTNANSKSTGTAAKGKAAAPVAKSVAKSVADPKADAAKADASKTKSPVDRIAGKPTPGTPKPAAAELQPASSRTAGSKAVEAKPTSSANETKPAEPDIGIQAPPGFRVTQYADDALAHDIFSMTIDASGRVVVSGPGYIKILVDADGDGKADAAKVFVDNLESGAQGMHFLGRDLLCTAGEGLVRYRDENGDDQADGPPETFLKVKTGGEHNAHAIRRGPDGW